MYAMKLLGEIIAEDDCDRGIATTLADFCNVGLVRAKQRSIQLVGSMPAETLQQISKDGYTSRFGASYCPLNRHTNLKTAIQRK
jgi:hypothetical protein